MPEAPRQESALNRPPAGLRQRVLQHRAVFHVKHCAGALVIPRASKRPAVSRETSTYLITVPVSLIHTGRSRSDYPGSPRPLSRVPGKASRPRDSAEPTTSQHARRTSHLRQTFATTREAPTRSISSRRRSPASGLRPRHTWALLRAQSPWHHESQFCRRVAFGRPSISPVAATRTWEVTIQVSGARRGPDGRPNGRAFGRGAPQSPVRGLWTGNRFT